MGRKDGPWSQNTTHVAAFEVDFEVAFQGVSISNRSVTRSVAIYGDCAPSGQKYVLLFMVIPPAAQVGIVALKVTRLPRQGLASSKLPFPSDQNYCYLQ